LGGHHPDTAALPVTDRVERAGRTGSSAGEPCLYLAEDDRAGADGDEVDLSPTGAEIPLDDAVSAALEVSLGDSLAKLAP
jgi:hypothetical protein